MPHLACEPSPSCWLTALVAVWGWRRLVARLAFVASLTAAALLDLDRLLFVLIILPVIVLFFLVLGPPGAWVARRSGAGAAGLGVSFPLFVAG